MHSYGRRQETEQTRTLDILREAGFVSVPSTGLRIHAEPGEGGGSGRVIGFVSGPEVGCGRLYNPATRQVAEVSAHFLWQWDAFSGTKGHAKPVSVGQFLEDHKCS